MNIHHSIVKAAAAKGITLTVEDDTILALHSAANVLGFRVVKDDEIEQSAFNDLARDAWNDAAEIVAYHTEHANVRIGRDDGDYIAYHTATEDEIARDPILVDLFETLADQPEDEQEDEEQEEGGSVVPAKYKLLYAEAGHPTHCGDWLAETLNRFCRVVDAETGKETTDLDALETIANANGVAPERYGKLGVATNGWQGRFRMTVRNMLTPRCAEKGHIFIPSDVTGKDEGDLELKAPEAWCREHAPKVKAKPVKTDAEKAKKPDGKKGAKAQAMDAGLKAASDAIKASKAKSASPQ